MLKPTEFPVTKQSLNTIGLVMKEQDEYGFDKYKKPLDHTDNYNWIEMFLQEAADGLKYIQCEMNRKNDVIEILEIAMKSHLPKPYIEQALEILNIKGTGK